MALGISAPKVQPRQVLWQGRIGDGGEVHQLSPSQLQQPQVPAGQPITTLTPRLGSAVNSAGGSSELLGAQAGPCHACQALLHHVARRPLLKGGVAGPETPPCSAVYQHCPRQQWAVHHIWQQQAANLAGLKHNTALPNHRQAAKHMHTSHAAPTDQAQSHGLTRGSRSRRLHPWPRQCDSTALQAQTSAQAPSR